MNKTFADLLDELAGRIETAQTEMNTNVSKEEEPNTYWYMVGVISAYQEVCKQVEENYL